MGKEIEIKLAAPDAAALEAVAARMRAWKRRGRAHGRRSGW